MRKTILTTGLFLLAIVAFSQTEEKNRTTYIRHPYTDHSMKASLDKDKSTMLPVGTYEINEKVLKSFNETFAAAQDVKWEEYKNYYTVSFVHSGIRSKVDYDKNGYIIGSLRYYAPQNLPLNIYNSLWKEYSKQELYGVVEVAVGAAVTYFVKMQDEKNWMTIKIDPSGNSTVYEKYRK
ncbi:MAG TPA: hypothetical protein VFN95_18225 [Flavitalea sp.]|nr:hypothetical protein [Flavitalea sp.]